MGARFSLKGNNISRIITQNYTPSKSIFESCQSFLKESTASAATERPKYECYDYEDDNQRNEYNYTYHPNQKLNYGGDDNNSQDDDNADELDDFNSEREACNNFAAEVQNKRKGSRQHEDGEIQYEAFQNPDNYGNECDAMMGTSQFYQPLREVIDNNHFKGEEEEDEEMTTRFKTDRNPPVHNSIDSKAEEESKRQIQTTEKKLSRRNSDIVNIPINYDEFLRKTERSRLRSEGTDTTLNSERCNYYPEQGSKKMVSEIAQKTDGDEVRYHTSRLETENVWLKQSRGGFGNEMIIGETTETTEEDQQISEQQQQSSRFKYNPPNVHNTQRTNSMSSIVQKSEEETRFSTQKKAGHFSNSTNEHNNIEYNDEHDHREKKSKNATNSRNTSITMNKSPSLSSLMPEQKSMHHRLSSSPSSLNGQKGKSPQLSTSGYAGGESKIERHLQDLEKRLSQMESMNNGLTAEKNKVKEEFQSLLFELQAAKQNTQLASTVGPERKDGGEKEVALKTEIKFLIGKLLKVKNNLEKQSEEMSMINSMNNSGVQTKKQQPSQSLHSLNRRGSVQSNQERYSSEPQNNPLYMTGNSNSPLSVAYSSNSTIKKNSSTGSSNHSNNPSYSSSHNTSEYNSNGSVKNTKSIENIHQKQQIIHENLLEKMKITKSNLGQAIENFSKNIRCRSNLRDNWSRDNSCNNSSRSSTNSNKVNGGYGRTQDENLTMRAKTPVLARPDDRKEVLLDFRKMRKNV